MNEALGVATVLLPAYERFRSLGRAGEKRVDHGQLAAAADDS